MGWKAIVETDSFLSYEFDSKEFSVRLEARATPTGGWDVFKTYFGKDITYSDQYYVQTREALDPLLQTLQSEALPALADLRKKSLAQAKKIKVRMQRSFKEYAVEKWTFRVNDDKEENVLYVHDADTLEITLVLYDGYRRIEKEILEEIYGILGLDKTSLDIIQEVYYYTSASRSSKKGDSPAVFFGRVEVS